MVETILLDGGIMEKIVPKITDRQETFDMFCLFLSWSLEFLDGGNCAKIAGNASAPVVVSAALIFVVALIGVA